MAHAYSTRGRATVAAAIVAAVVILGAGAAYYFSTPAIPPEKKQTVQKETPPIPSSAVLADTPAPLLDFTKADFDAAVKSDKLVVLYFYANWCPICRAEFPKAAAAFNELTTDRVIGFRVNFNDNQTDADEVALAREHGIAYQHTKVFIKNGRQVLKSPESWEQSRYVTEITNALAIP